MNSFGSHEENDRGQGVIEEEGLEVLGERDGNGGTGVAWKGK